MRLSVALAVFMYIWPVFVSNVPPDAGFPLYMPQKPSTLPPSDLIPAKKAIMKIVELADDGVIVTFAPALTNEVLVVVNEVLLEADTTCKILP